MEIALLGGVTLRSGDQEVPLGGRRQAAVLAVLAIERGRTVGSERLLREVWGGSSDNLGTLQGCVYRLRGVVPSGWLATADRGYRLEVEPAVIDAVRFESLLAAGRRRPATESPEALADFDAALALWRGPAMDGFDDVPLIHREALRLEELRLRAIEGQSAAALACGLHADLVGRLEALVVEEPLREALWANLMLALYRSGRQADALRSAQALRRQLADELGIDPCRAVRDLELQILRHDPSLDLPTPSDGSTAAGSALVTAAVVPEVPALRYAASRSHSIAFRSSGSGPDLVASVGAGPGSLLWEADLSAALVERLTRRHRLIAYDQLGTGYSDPVIDERLPDIEELATDLVAVADAAGASSFVLLGAHDGAAVAIAVAARVPWRVRALVLYNAYARLVVADDYALGLSPLDVTTLCRAYEQSFGTGFTMDFHAPSRRGDPGARRTWARWEQRTASRSQSVALTRMALAVDVRPLLSEVHCPTLVLHVAGNRAVPIEHARYLADHLDGARLVELSGTDHSLWVSDPTRLGSEIDDLLGSSCEAPERHPGGATPS